MGLAVVTVAAGGLPVVESTTGGTPVTEATNGYGVPVTKVAALGMPVVFETIGVGGGGAPPIDAVTGVTGAWSLSRNMLTSFSGTRYTKTGTAIISLTDQTGNGRHFTDGATASRRPVETTAFPSNVLCADFDGVNHFLTTNLAVSNFVTSTSGAMIVSVIIDAVTLSGATYGGHGILADAAPQYMGLFANNVSGLTFTAAAWTTGETAVTKTGAVATPYVLMWRRHASQIYISLNGGAETAFSSPFDMVTTAILLLGQTGGGNRCNMKVAEVFITNNGAQTTELAAAIAGMMTQIGVAPGVTYTTWNPADLTNVTLSNGNLKATLIGNGGARGITSKSSGKYYLEYTYTTINTNSVVTGLSLASSNLTNPVAGVAYLSRLNGSISVNGLEVGGAGTRLGTISPGAVIGVAVDLTAQLIWFRIAPAGNWNNSGTANPATGVGGISISTISSGPLYPYMSGQNIDAITANFGASAFSGAVPAGFTSGWPA